MAPKVGHTAGYDERMLKMVALLDSGKSYREIADQFGLGLDYVRSLIRKAKAIRDDRFDKQERNAAIVRLYESNFIGYKKIGAQFGISGIRVRQIIMRAERLREKKLEAI